MHYPRLRAGIHALRRQYPFLCLYTIGTTCYGRALMALRLGRGPRTVLIHGAHHANEWITSALLLRFAADYCAALSGGRTLAGYDVRRLSRAVSLWLVPMVNPDGVDLVTGALPPDTQAYQQAQRLSRSMPQLPFPAGWKANLCGVDLNLNYPAGWDCACRNKAALGVTGPAPRDFAGFSPLSERESMAMVTLTARLRPQLSLSYHTQGREIYWQYRTCAAPGAEALGQRLAQVSGYRLTQTPPQSAYAGYKDWALQTYGGFAYTIEAGLGENPLPISQLPQLYRENLPLMLLAMSGAPQPPA